MPYDYAVVRSIFCVQHFKDKSVLFFNCTLLRRAKLYFHFFKQESCRIFDKLIVRRTVTIVLNGEYNTSGQERERPVIQTAEDRLDKPSRTGIAACLSLRL